MIKDFMKVASCHKYRYSEIIQCENDILKFLKWDLMVLTPLNALYLLIGQGTVFPSDKIKDAPIDHKKLRCIRKYSEFFCDLSA
jgi:hypothetical protein